jgi:cytochrome c peroxidase
MSRLLASTSLLGLAAACTGTVDAQPTTANTHGAATMDAQLEQLPRLELLADPSVAPRGIDAVVWAASIPPDNKPTAARIALGEKLYFDVRLSRDGTVACATCHDVTRTFTDRRPASEGIGGAVGRRNAPTTMNAMLLQSQFWDGRAGTLEEQALLPIVNSIEMGFATGDEAVAAIAGDAAYVELFQDAYGRAPNYDDVGRALATFQRTLVFLDAPFDAWAAGDAKAISDDAKRGFVLYNGKARCVTCHPLSVANPLGSDGRFHNIGVSARHQDFDQLATRALEVLARDGSEATMDELALGGDTSELGRFIVSRIESDIGGFRTPQLRNVGITPPYMHDGSMQTLWDVMDHYNRGGEANHYLDGGIEPLALTEEEIDQVVAFMFTLTDRRFAEQNQRDLDAQRTRKGEERPFKEDDLALRRRLLFETTTK